jgi:hypothetical protein
VGNVERLLNERRLSPGSCRRTLTLTVVAVVGLAVSACLSLPGSAVKPTTAPTPVAATPATLIPTGSSTGGSAAATPTDVAATVSAPTSSAPTVSAPTQPPPALSSDQVVAARQAAWVAYAAYAKTGPVRVKQVTSQNNVPISSITTELVPTDQLHEVVELMGQVASERYVYGGHLYARYPASGKATWTQTPVISLQPYADSFGVLSEGAVVTTTDGLVLGVEVINGENTVIYGYSSQLHGVAVKSPNKLWVSQVRGLPLRYAKDLPQGGQLVQDYIYDPSLTITLPPEVAAAPTAKP